MSGEPESMSDGAAAFAVGSASPLVGRSEERVSVKNGGKSTARRRAARRDAVFARCVARVAESRASLLLAHRMGSEGKAALEQIIADEFMEEFRAAAVESNGGGAAASSGLDAVEYDEDDLTDDERVDFLVELEQALFASLETEMNSAVQIWEDVCAADEEETARAIKWYEENYTS